MNKINETFLQRDYYELQMKKSGLRMMFTIYISDRLEPGERLIITGCQELEAGQPVFLYRTENETTVEMVSGEKISLSEISISDIERLTEFLLDLKPKK